MKRFLLSLLLLFCLFLAACGGSSAASPSATPNAQATQNLQDAQTTGSTTPTSGNDPTTLHVTRTDPSATNNLGPLDKTVTDAQTVQQLYHMAVDMPKFPTGASISQSCLGDLGVIYHLDFQQGVTDVQRMNLDPGNCKILYFSQTDLRQVSDDFLNLLKQSLHVNSLTSN